MVEAAFQSGTAMGIASATVPDPCCPAPIEFCPSGGETIVLEAPPNLTNYQWYFDDGMGGGSMPINGATNDTYEASMVGTYSWTAFDPDACDIGSCCPIELIEKTITITGAAPAMCVYNATEDRSETVVTVDFSWSNISSDGMGDFEDIEVIMTGGTVFGNNVQTIDPMNAADNDQVTFTMLADGSGPYTVEVRFANDILCRATAEITPPLPDECPPCGITDAMAEAICNDNGTADPSDDTFTVTLNPTVMNAGGATYEVSGTQGVNPITTVTGIAYGSTQILGTYNIADGDLTITIADETDGTCQLVDILVAAPATCSPCELIVNTATPTTCNGGTYDVTFDIDYFNAPSGALQVLIDGLLYTTVATTLPQATNEMVTVTGIPCDGQSKTVTLEFTDDNTCEDQATFQAPSLEYDFGDAPNNPYPTLLSNNGARHLLGSGIVLGAEVDADDDGQGTTDADGDDNEVMPDDEDGVDFVTMNMLVAGMDMDIDVIVDVPVTVTNPVYLNAWVDFDADGNWTDLGEQIFTNELVADGTNNLTFSVPDDVTAADLTYLRFRLSTEQNLSPIGEAPDGEVEDYALPQKALDLGDAPDTYFTSLMNNGASHIVDPATPLFLGSTVDTEGDGQPETLADGDDNAGLPDDEDGVVFVDANGDPTMIIACETTAVEVTVTGTGATLDAWVDFDSDGMWQGDEQIFMNEPVADGVNNLSFDVPCDAVVTDRTYLRFRLSTENNLAVTGVAADGEVEDYEMEVKGLDLGDLPTALGYPTEIIDDGARHVVPDDPQLVLGTVVDTETDGQPEGMALGDDNVMDDEDGIVFPNVMLVACQENEIEVTVTAAVDNGVLNAWVDFSNNGMLEGAEQIFTNEPVGNGTQTLTFDAPCDIVAEDMAFARFRLSTEQDLQPTGLAMDGEVEDYVVPLKALDLGDAPNPYPTEITDNGAGHIVPETPELFLGSVVDTDADGQPEGMAEGDDGDTDGDDEDGIDFLGNMLITGEEMTIEVTVTGTGGLLDAWVDFNDDGDWNDDGEQIFTNEAVTGTQMLSFVVPADATVTELTFLRFRLSTQGNLSPIGIAMDGEVEDYAQPIKGLDFGDVPETAFPTTVMNDGARHVVPETPTVFLGSTVDTEPDGQPEGMAAGDDGQPPLVDDEDGVVFDNDMLITGEDTEITITASVAGILNAWVDYDGDGTWDGADEQIFTDQALTAGANVLTIAVPATATVADLTYLRFRFDTAGGLSYDGLAMDGEVEDYALPLKGLDYGDNPDPFATLDADDGARHVVPATPELFLGSTVDTETDGTPDAMAEGDDNDVSPDDEDGVVFENDMLVACIENSITVTVTGDGGVLNAWIDFNNDNDWDDAGEQVFVDEPVGNGINELTITVPCDVTPDGTVFTRFRLSTEQGISYTGLTMDGEVEDYEVVIKAVDFGDLPDPYATLEADEGPRHIVPAIPEVLLGSTVDRIVMDSLVQMQGKLLVMVMMVTLKEMMKMVLLNLQ